MYRLTEAAADRPNQTIHAAGVFHDNARSIALACADAGNGEVVVAAVSWDHAFRGIWTVPLHSLSSHVTSVDDGGWIMTFAVGADVPEVEERCIKLARLAFARWEAMRRWASKHA